MGRSSVATTFVVAVLCASCTCNTTDLDRAGVRGDASTGGGSGNGPADSSASVPSEARPDSADACPDPSKPFRCDVTKLANVPWGPVVTVQTRPWPPPDVLGGDIVPGDYQLVAETRYGNAPPNTSVVEPGERFSRIMHVDCNVMYEVAKLPSGQDGANGCKRLVPHSQSVLDVSGWNATTPDPRDEAAYTASGHELAVTHLYPYWDSSPYTVLGAFAVVDEFVLISAGPTVAAPIIDAGVLPVPQSRDPRCPSMPPASGDPCSPDPAPLECEYGGDYWHRCSALALCALNADGTYHFWFTEPEPCTPPNPPECPQTYQAAVAVVASLSDGGAPFAFVDGGVASQSLSDSTVCNYPEGICGCGLRSFGDPCPWQCRSGQKQLDGRIDARCPARRPLAGDPCVPGLSCDYEIPCTPTSSLGPSMICQGGYWAQFHASFYGCGAM